jgi:hypothetical protein
VNENNLNRETAFRITNRDTQPRLGSSTTVCVIVLDVGVVALLSSLLQAEKRNPAVADNNNNLIDKIVGRINFV